MREYVQDCLDLLALPTGAIQHFRYRERHLDKRLVERMRDAPEGLRGLPVVPCFLATKREPDGTWQSKDEFVPLRRGKLLDARFVGSIAHFYFSVDEYLNYEKDPSASPSSLVRNLIVTHCGSSTRPFGVVLSDATRNSTHDAATAFQSFAENAYVPGAWRTLSAGEAPVDITYQALFYRLAGLFEEVDESDDVRLVEPTVAEIGGGVPYWYYRLRRGTTHHIAIEMHAPSAASADLPGHGVAQLHLELDPTLIDGFGLASLAVASPYDADQWTIVPRTANRTSTLRVRCRATAHPSRQGFVRSEVLAADIAVPVQIVEPS